MTNVSLKNRMFLTIVVGLFVLLLTHVGLGLVYDRTVQERVETSLNSYAKSLASGMDFVDGALVFKSSFPDSRFTERRSGLGAVVFANNQVIWKSPSTDNYPPPPTASPSNQPVGNPVGRFSLASHEFLWHRLVVPVMVESGDTAQLVDVFVFEDGESTLVELESFRSAVLRALMLSFGFILIAQTIATRWSLRPLKRISHELDLIRRGKAQGFSHTYPSELEGLTQSLNELLKHEAEQTETYRHTLANLAHSLKTPLAVLKTAMDNPDDDEVRSTFARQVQKIDSMVSYQLSMAARSGKATFSLPLSLEPIAVDIVEGLEKIHAQKGALCEFEIEDNIQFPANKGDMQELLGNLLENAFKWCASRVLLTIQQGEKGLCIQVEDDGAGVPEDKASVIMMRGHRADEHVQGHGIGLAIVSDIVRSYQGTLSIIRSEELGGAQFTVTLPRP